MVRSAPDARSSMFLYRLRIRLVTQGQPSGTSSEHALHLESYNTQVNVTIRERSLQQQKKGRYSGSY